MFAWMATTALKTLINTIISTFTDIQEFSLGCLFLFKKLKFTPKFTLYSPQRNKGHIIAAELLPHSTRFKDERHMNFVPLTNWANHANSDEAIDMHYFESEMLYRIKNMNSYEKIFYRITPIFLSNEVVLRAMILEGKLIHKNNT